MGNCYCGQKRLISAVCLNLIADSSRVLIDLVSRVCAVAMNNVAEANKGPAQLKKKDSPESGPHSLIDNITISKNLEEVSLKQRIDNLLSLNGGYKAPLLIDELLNDVPEPRSKHSLFQNYVLNTQSQTNMSYSLALQREAVACEVQDLDYMIAQFKQRRQKAFNKMIDLESTSKNPTSKANLIHFYKPGEEIHHIKVADGPLTSLDSNSPFGSLVCTADNVLSLHSLNLDSPISLKGTEHKKVNCTVLHGADPIIIVGADNDLFWYSQESQNPLFYAEPSQLSGHVGPVVAVNYDGHTAVSSSLDKTVRQWDHTAGKCSLTLDTFEFGVCNSLQHENVVLVTGSQDGVVRLWDLRTGKPERELVGGHTSPISTLQFSGLELVSGADDGSLRSWDLRNGQILLAEAYNDKIQSVGFDDVRIVTQVRNENMARVIDKKTGDQRMLAISDSIITSSKYIDGFFIAGRDTGDVGVWAV